MPLDELSNFYPGIPDPVDRMRSVQFFPVYRSAREDYQDLRSRFEVIVCRRKTRGKFHQR